MIFIIIESLRHALCAQGIIIYIKYLSFFYSSNTSGLLYSLLLLSRNELRQILIIIFHFRELARKGSRLRYGRGQLSSCIFYFFPALHHRIEYTWLHSSYLEPAATYIKSVLQIMRATAAPCILLTYTKGVPIFAPTILTTPTRNDHTHSHKQYGCPHKPRENGVG